MRVYVEGFVRKLLSTQYLSTANLTGTPTLPRGHRLYAHTPTPSQLHCTAVARKSAGAMVGLASRCRERKEMVTPPMRLPENPK